MAVNEQAVTLDVTKPDVWQLPELVLRQGDMHGKTLIATITDNGEPFNLAGYDVYFDMQLPDKATYYRQRGEVDGNTVTVTIDETKAGAVVGETKVAYIAIEQDGELIASTGNLLVTILKNAKNGAVPAESWTSDIDEALEAIETATETAQGAAAAADEARQSAEQAAVDIAAETTRQQAAYQQAESARGSAFNASQSERETAFSDSQSARDTAFNTAQNARESAFNNSQTARQTAYQAAESARDDQFELNEQERTNQAVQAAKAAVDEAVSEIGIVKDANYVHTDNNYTTDEKAKLAAIEEGANNFELQVMSKDVLGGATLGQGLTVDGGALSIGDVVTDETNGPIYSVDAEGWSEQDTTTGKNLLDESLFGKLNKDLKRIQIALPDGTYTASSTCPLDANSANILVGAGYLTSYSGMTTANSGVYSGKSRTLQPADGYITVFCRKNDAYDLHDYQTQLEAGSTATSYEPYTGGKPSPSPDYPQEVRVARGRNLLNFNAPRKTGDFSAQTTRNMDGNGVWVGITVNNYYNNSRIQNLTESDGVTSFTCTQAGFGIGIEVAVSPNTEYAWSAAHNENTQVGFGFYTSGGSYIGTSSISSSNSGIITTPSDCAYMTMVLRAKSDGVSCEYRQVQLELGSTPTPYVPYGHVGLEVTHDGTTTVTPIPLPLKSDGERWAGGLPDGAADTLAIDSAGRWEWESATTEITSSSNPILKSAQSNRAIYQLGDNEVKKSTSVTSVPNAYASHFTGVSQGSTWLPGTFSVPNSSGTVNPGYVAVTVDPTINTVELFRSEFANLSIITELATPTTESGYIDLPEVPDGATITCPELREVGVKCFVPGVSELIDHANNWGARCKENESRIAALEAAIANLATS